MLLVGITDRFPPRESSEMKSLAPKDYPKLFGEDMIIVVGENATAVEKGPVILIKENLENLTGNKSIIENDTGLLKSDKRTHNLILVGTPNTNYVPQEVYKLTNVTRITTEYPEENKGILEILRNPWNPDKTSLTVAGNDEWGVKTAASELTRSEELENYHKSMKKVKINMRERGAGYSQELITVKFVQGSKVYLREGKLVTLNDNKLKPFYEVLAHYPGLQVERLFTRSEQKLHEERKEGEIRSGKELPDLNLYYRLRVPSGTNIVALINDLNNLEMVEIAYPAPLPAPPPSHSEV